MNPYASYLGERDPLPVLAATPTQLSALVDTLGPQGVERALAPGKWSMRKILCHLADCELVFAFRLRQTLAEPHYVIQPFDQDKWARSYDAYAVRPALETFTAVRNWNIFLIEATPRDAFSKPVTHPERGVMTFRVLIETMAGHDLSHLQQLEAIAALPAAAAE
ncbi:MAG TPA: DinB family protein [Bryobacteraceae bacterium]|nr:DinB family protein [Bryobacteraceae bacterium]